MMERVEEPAADGRLISMPRVIYRKTKRGRVARLLREHYVRTDEREARECLARLPSLGQEEPVSANHFVLPDAQVTQHFLELIEFELHLQHLIWTDTVLKEVPLLSLKINRVETRLPIYFIFHSGAGDPAAASVPPTEVRVMGAPH